MEPFFFGPPKRRLFGVYHAPLRERDPPAGVVLCYPMGQEYVRSHRSFLELALRLARAGLHALRFDFSGCGDSELDMERSRLHDWIEDVGTAVDELRASTEASRIALCGLRLGASIAATSARANGAVEGVVLWDPILDGRLHLQELRQQHRRSLDGSFARPREGASGAEPEEILGFPLDRTLATDILEVDPSLRNRSSVRWAVVADTQGHAALDGYCGALRSLGVEVERLNLPSRPAWAKDASGLESTPVPTPVLEAIAASLERRLLVAG